ncbi:MAG: hypothetical protein K0S71_1714 [Clostridia bacterium]|jgi:uncharacterized membrane protein YfcA|nr:hypothetical protein [Clostridia bacterium]
MQNIFLLIFTFLAYFVKAITGFGNTLVMGSLFSFIVPNTLTTPIDLIFSIPTNLFMVIKERKNISLRVVIPLSLMLLAGSIPGTLLLKMGNEWLLKSGLGIVVIGLAIEMMRKPAKEAINKKNNPFFLVIIGVVSGILAGLYGIGALLVSYISRTTDNKSQFRANICCVFLVDNLFRFMLYQVTGLLNKEILFLTLLLSPAVFLGMKIGLKVDTHIGEETTRKVIIGLLMISGALLFFKNIFNH